MFKGLRSALVAGVFVLAMLPASLSHAIIPDPDASTVPGCLRVSPGGSLPLQVTVIGTNGLPIAGEEVRLILDDSVCPVDAILSCADPSGYVISGVTNGAGQVDLIVNLSGCCEAAAVGIIEADPGSVALEIYDVIASTDSFGLDGVVAISDFVAFQAAFLGADACYDYANCDGQVQLVDFVAFQADFLAECP
jgi:hypothetical protein